MVDEEGLRKKRKTASEPEACLEQPIEALQRFKELHASWPEDVTSLLSETLSQARRQQLWDLVTLQASQFVDEFAWAVPDDRALRILAHFSPIIEIAAGAGYWAHCMRARGIGCAAFDRYPPTSLEGHPRPLWSEVASGDAAQLMEPAHANVETIQRFREALAPPLHLCACGAVRTAVPLEMLIDKTLLLCYPDDFEHEEGLSVAAQCLEALQGATVVHCGELFGDTVSLDHAPWGRTTSAAAQQHLFSLFRCVLKVPLPSWPHCSDYLTVWRRMPTCHVGFRELSAAGEGAGHQPEPAPAPAPAAAAAPEKLEDAARETETESRQQSAAVSQCAGAGARATEPQQAAAAAAAKNNTDSRKRAQLNSKESGGRARKSATEGAAAQRATEEEAAAAAEVRCDEVQEGEGDEVVEEGGSGEEESEEAEGGEGMEFLCGARSFSLGAEGWALPVFRHLL